MPHDPRAWMWDIQQAAGRVRRFLGGHDLQSYRSDELVRSAVERQFEILGEAMAQLAKHSPELAAAIPHWRDVIAFRNLLIHGYSKIDDERVWRIAQIDLPPLVQAVERLLDAPAPGSCTT